MFRRTKVIPNIFGSTTLLMFREVKSKLPVNFCDLLFIYFCSLYLMNDFRKVVVNALINMKTICHIPIKFIKIQISPNIKQLKKMTHPRQGRGSLNG
jgi:hypothetical protein